MALATRPKPNINQRRRHGQHHTHTRHYMKHYWPYLPMLLIVVVGIAINSILVWSSSAVLGSSSDFTSDGLLSNTNTQRLKDGEQALTIDARLSQAAQAKANDMVARDYWSHNTPDGKAPWTFINATGYQYQAAGENLAYGFTSAADAVTGWMNSPEHRANILDSNYQNVGFGVASSQNYQGKGPETVVVAEYARPAQALVTTGGVAGAHDPSLATPASTQSVSRIQLMTGGQASWSDLLVSAIAGGALVFIVIRYSLLIKRLALESEAFIAHHPLLDTTIVLVITVGFLLTRSSGLIR